MCAVPKIWMMRDPRYQDDTWGSHSAEFGGGVTSLVSALDGLIWSERVDAPSFLSHSLLVSGESGSMAYNRVSSTLFGFEK